MFLILLRLFGYRWDSNSDSLRGVNLGGASFSDYMSQRQEVLPDSDDFDPYTTYYVRKLGENCRNLTQPIRVLDVNFNNEQVRAGTNM